MERLCLPLAGIYKQKEAASLSFPNPERRTVLIKVWPLLKRLAT